MTPGLSASITAEIHTYENAIPQISGLSFSPPGSSRLRPVLKRRERKLRLRRPAWTFCICSPPPTCRHLPREIAASEKWRNGITRSGLPGKGLAQHPMLYVGENCNTMFLVNDGKVIWTYSTGSGPEFDDVWMLSNGNILFSRMAYVAEITPDKKVVWRYDCHVPGGPAHTEFTPCQPIGLDKVMFVENGLPPKLKVVNIKTGAVEVDHELPYNPSAAGSRAVSARTRHRTGNLSRFLSEPGLRRRIRQGLQGNLEVQDQHRPGPPSG